MLKETVSMQSESFFKYGVKVNVIDGNVGKSSGLFKYLNVNGLVLPHSLVFIQVQNISQLSQANLQL